MTLTERQEQFLQELSQDIDHYLLPGGARAGKTFLIIACIVIRAIKYPKSRHLIARFRFNHAKVSIFMDTLPKVIELLGLKDVVKINRTDSIIEFHNGAEIWIDGLDSADRVEKILGREYATIFFNEVSQIGYHTVTTVRTRLAQKIEGCHNICFYDCNPTGRGHWAYKEFVKGENPDTGVLYPEAIRSRFLCFNMSPYDNKDNLPEGFIKNSLETLPEAKRKRFLLGEWSDPEGVIFQNWSIVDEIPDDVRRKAKHTIGVDFGFSVDPATVTDCYESGKDLYIDELVYETGLINSQLAKRIKDLNIGYTEVYCDSAEPKSIAELKSYGINVKPCTKGADSVRAGIDYLLDKKIFITRRSQNIIMEFENYTWKKDMNERCLPEPIDDWDHSVDGIRYACLHKPTAKVTQSGNIRRIARI